MKRTPADTLGALVSPHLEDLDAALARISEAASAVMVGGMTSVEETKKRRRTKHETINPDQAVEALRNLRDRPPERGGRASVPALTNAPLFVGVAADAARVLALCRRIRDAVASGDAGMAALLAIRLGQDASAIHLDDILGSHADFSIGRAKGGETTRGEHAAERDVRRRIFGEVIAERPGAKVDAWARAAAKRYTSAHPEKIWTREAARRFFYDHVRKV